MLLGRPLATFMSHVDASRASNVMLCHASLWELQNQGFALSAVAKHALHVFLTCQEEQLGEGKAERVVPQMVAVHQSARDAAARFQEQLRRPLFVTPKNYLDFVAAYRAQLREHRTRLAETAARLDGGLQRLVQARYAFCHRKRLCKLPACFVDVSNSEAGERVTEQSLFQQAGTMLDAMTTNVTAAIAVMEAAINECTTLLHNAHITLPLLCRPAPRWTP